MTTTSLLLLSSSKSCEFVGESVCLFVCLFVYLFWSSLGNSCVYGRVCLFDRLFVGGVCVLFVFLFYNEPYILLLGFLQFLEVGKLNP